MTAEPGNLTGLNSFKYSGLAGKMVLGLDSKKVGKKESIVLTTRSKRKGRQQRPGTVLVTTGIKKGSKKGPEQLKKIIATTYNRPEMLAMALTKYSKIKKSFKKKVALQSASGRSLLRVQINGKTARTQGLSGAGSKPWMQLVAARKKGHAVVACALCASHAQTNLRMSAHDPSKHKQM
ncbi:Rpl28 [Symbiodinium necroappetens]|uniref:Rpl28 protein n=1 Tax=Symbiodinium necroappetens TaxID=1628268 RepID=A0A813CBJ3_9DINO|nr:Rpl28 [Symbiodinium necroappetens]